MIIDIIYWALSCAQVHSKLEPSSVSHSEYMSLDRMTMVVPWKIGKPLILDAPNIITLAESYYVLFPPVNQ